MLLRGIIMSNLTNTEVEAITKDDILEKCGVSESWYDPYYLLRQTFKDELSNLSEQEIKSALKVAILAVEFLVYAV
jgi:hypothetical protein